MPPVYMAIERDWSSYNDALVRRGYMGIDPSTLDSWRRELKKENRGKVGLPYRYPESFTRLIAYMRMIFHVPYRQAEGFVVFLSEHIEGLSVPDYSTIASCITIRVLFVAGEKASPSRTTRPLRGGQRSGNTAGRLPGEVA